MVTSALQNITPRHREMMLRMLRGERDKAICQDMGITQARLSVIKHSPLFQLELQKMMARREEQLYSIQDNFLDATEMGVKFHKTILEQPTDPLTKKEKMQSATLMTALASRLLRPGIVPSDGDGDEGEGQSYEERLRKVTIEESIKTVTHQSPPEDDVIDVDKLLDENHPPTSELEIEDEKETIFGDTDVEDDVFNPPEKIEKILACADCSLVKSSF